MTNGELTPKQAHEVLKNLGALESLKLNLNEHAMIQRALGVIGNLVATQDKGESLPEKAST